MDFPFKSEDLELGFGWLDHHIWVSSERNKMNIIYNLLWSHWQGTSHMVEVISSCARRGQLL